MVQIKMREIEIVKIKQVKKKELLVDFPSENISSPQDYAKIIGHFLKDEDREHFVVGCLNTKNDINALHTVSIGTLNSSLVHPREVFKLAILNNSNSIILAHNHPSGNPLFSEQDCQITKRLQDAGEILGIKVLDHIIMGDSQYLSFKEKGML